MQMPEGSTRAQSRSFRYAGRALVLITVLTLPACGRKPDATMAQNNTGGKVQRAGDPRVVACTLMPKEEMNILTGAAYTSTNSSDDGHSSESNCHYFTESDPAGMSLNISWVSPTDYSNPVEHAALQKAGVGGAKLGGKVMEGMPRAPGIPNGPVEDVGDEATMNNMMLTARKGDYTIVVQIIPTDMMAIMTDTTVANALTEKEKAIARKVFTKL